MNRRKKGMPMKNRMISTLLLAMIPIGVAAGQVISTRTRTIANGYSDGASHLIPLNDAGSTVLPFVTTTDNQRIVISFNAECAVAASNWFAFVNLDILVDGAPTSPSSNDNAFCTSHNFAGGGGWVSAVSTSVFIVPDPGLHNVQVRGFLASFSAGNSWSIDDSSTIVME
jgi:hypothetical protein